MSPSHWVHPQPSLSPSLSPSLLTYSFRHCSHSSLLPYRVGAHVEEGGRSSCLLLLRQEGERGEDGRLGRKGVLPGGKEGRGREGGRERG
jgi:hypothetical protein